MSRIMSILVGDGQDDSIVVYVPGEAKPLIATSDHPNFARIVTAVAEQDYGVVDLFDVAELVAQTFAKVSERVTSANGELFLDGDKIEGRLADQIIESLKYGDEGLESLVNFLERLANNPNPEAVGQLYDWIEASGQFTIDADGMIVGYKGVTNLGDGTFQSISSGRALVNGVEQKGRITQSIGDEVTMPRSEVQYDPMVGCSTGLHVGTFAYANSFGSHLLEVRVDPRDVVSVPTECSAQKMRTCRYTIVGDIEREYDTAYVGLEFSDFDAFDDDLWGDYDEEYIPEF